MRKLDGKYHITEDRIVNTSTGAIIPEDEPLFLFRAKDALAISTLVAYKQMCINTDCKPEQIAGVEREINKFRNYFTNINSKNVKLPD